MADPPSNPRRTSRGADTSGDAVGVHAHSARGDRVRADPGTLEQEIAGALAPTRFGPIEHFAEIDSTNEYLLERARAGATTGLVVVADHQHAGRGRLGRRWTTPAGASLLVSVLLRPRLPLERWHLLTTTAGLAAIDAVAALTHAAVEPRLKWPNDLVTGGGKLAGLLAEATGDALVVGMGLNIDWPEIPPDLDGVATAIDRERVRAVPGRAELLIAWLRRWNGWLAIAEAPAGTERVRAAVDSVSATLGCEVRVELDHESFTGVARHITDAGHLVVDTNIGPREVNAGDVVHLRSST